MRSALPSITALLLVTSGCAVFRAVPRDDDPQRNAQVEATTTPEASLRSAEQQLAVGDLAAATKELERVVRIQFDQPVAARALFELAALQWNPSNPRYDPEAALANLRQIVGEHPDSPWAPAAAVVLEMARDRSDLQAAVSALRRQLEALKQLDLDPQG